MKILSISIIALLFSTSVLSQTFYGLTFGKAYTREEIKEHFWDKEVTFNNNDIRVQIGENEINFYFTENKLIRILSFDPSESKASSMYEDAKLLFGKPTGGFEEEKITYDDLFNGPSVTQKNYRFYYINKYKKDDVLEVRMDVTNSGYSYGKLNKKISFEISYSSWGAVDYWIKPESNYSRGLFKGWKIKKQF